MGFFFACSGPNDHVFVYFTDHGAPGLIAFPESEVSLIKSQASAGFLVPLLFCEQTHKQEYNSCTICTEACANVAGVTQIIFHNNNCKRWNVQHVLSIGKRKNPSPSQTHHLSDTRQEPKYSVLFGETCGEPTKSLLGSYM